MNVPYDLPLKKPWNPKEIDRILDSLIDEICESLKPNGSRTIFHEKEFGEIKGRSYTYSIHTFDFLKNRLKVEWPYNPTLEVDYYNILKFEVYLKVGDFTLWKWKDSINPEICFPDGVDSLKEAMTEKEFADNILEMVDKVFRREFKRKAVSYIRKAHFSVGLNPRKED